MPVEFVVRVRPPKGLIDLTLDPKNASKAVQDRTSPIVSAALDLALGKALGQTNPRYKYDARGKLRTPLPDAAGVVRGSGVQQGIYVETEPAKTNAANGLSLRIAASSRARVRGGRYFTIDLLEFGHRGAGVITKPVAFWGGQGTVFARRWRHVAVKGRKFIAGTLTRADREKLQAALVAAIAEAYRSQRKPVSRTDIEAKVTV